jgi:GWxTD domain-containing protein
MKKKLLSVNISIIIVLSCSVPYELSKQNLNYLYEYQTSFTQPSYVLFHSSDTVSTLYYSFQWSDFQYIKSNEKAAFTAHARINIYLRESYESISVLDSTTVLLTDSSHFGLNKILIDSVNFYTPREGEYLLEIRLRDANRNQELTSFVPVYKSDLQDQQYFIAREPSGIPLLSPYISNNQEFYISASKNTEHKIFVRYYRRNFPIAIPPFAVDYGEPFDYKEDSLFSVEMINGRTPAISLAPQGFYHFQPDTSVKEGFTLFRFYKDFPSVKTPADALPPLRYLTTHHEFEKLSASTNIKLSVDSFWLDNSGNVDRAKAQIAKFYNRVQDANLFFSSYIEGWKTDRGMVYIVFGPPNHVYRGINTENWVYGEAGNSLSVRFNFIRVNNPFSFNDYSLYRNPYFKESWFNSVENWRR